MMKFPIYGTIRNVRNKQKPAISMVLAREISGWVYPEIFQGLKIFTAVWSIKLLLNFDTNPLGPGKNTGEPEEPTNSQFGSAQTLLVVIP